MKGLAGTGIKDKDERQREYRNVSRKIITIWNANYDTLSELATLRHIEFLE